VCSGQARSGSEVSRQFCGTLTRFKLWPLNFTDLHTRFTVLPPISTAGLSVSDVPELTTLVRDQMLTTLREISVKVTSEEDMKPADQPADSPAVEEPDPIPAAPVEVAPDEVPDVPSDEDGSETPSVDTSLSRSLRQEGSVSEYGTETDDEGMVVVGRQHH